MTEADEAGARRPSPEALLEAAEREERIRFRLFVGPAPAFFNDPVDLELVDSR